LVSLEKLSEILEKAFNDRKGNLEQIDDVYNWHSLIANRKIYSPGK
jgi:hypothetical protein